VWGGGKGVEVSLGEKKQLMAVVREKEEKIRASLKRRKGNAGDVASRKSD
jgi:hypothetical protein